MKNQFELNHLLRTRNELKQDGFTNHIIKRRVENGDFIRIRHGIYLPRQTYDELTPWEHRMVEVLAINKTVPGTVFSHSSAAMLLELPVLQAYTNKVHIYCSATSRGYAKGCTRHPFLTDETLIEQNALGAKTTDIATTIIDCAKAFSYQQGAMVADKAISSALVAPDALKEKMLDYEGRNFRKVHRVAHIMSHLAESPGETLTRLLLIELGIYFIEQYEFQLATGLYRVDFYLPGHNIVIEFDGRIKYTDFGAEPEVLRQERARERALLKTGVRILRTSWEEVFTYPHLFKESLLKLIASK